MNQIVTSGTRFIDDKGRERIFNGVNYVYKGVETDENGALCDVIHYKDHLTDELLSALAAKGVNVIRLGCTWAGIEPEMTRYNMVYLSEYKAAAQRCAKYGIYVFLDWHQDLYSPFCFRWGDGAPKWACKYTKRPKKARFIWAEGYFFDRNVQRCFDAFWNNEEVQGRGLRDRFCDMLTFVANYFADCDNILGYDVFNEPYPGTAGGKIFRNIVANGAGTLLLSANVDRKKLLADAKKKDVMAMLSVADDPTVYRGVIGNAEKTLTEFDTGVYYDFICAAAAAIRRATDKGVVFMENSYYSNTGIPCRTPHAVLPDGKKEPHLAFSPHGYDITVDSPLTNEASPHRVDFIFAEHKRKQERMGIPVLVGEWGGMVPGGDAYPALEHLIDLFDANRWSQTYWHLLEDMPNTKIMEVLNRPYPQAVAGTIKRYGYDRKNGVFDLSYTGDAAVKAPTLIYLPKEPKKVFSTKAYTLKKENGAVILQVNAGKGECAVKVEF